MEDPRSVSPRCVGHRGRAARSSAGARRASRIRSRTGGSCSRRMPCGCALPRDSPRTSTSTPRSCAPASCAMPASSISSSVGTTSCRATLTTTGPAAIEGLTAKIREHLGGRADLFVADFSTTGPPRAYRLAGRAHGRDAPVLQLHGRDDVRHSRDHARGDARRLGVDPPACAACSASSSSRGGSRSSSPSLAKLEETSRGDDRSRVLESASTRSSTRPAAIARSGWMNSLFPLRRRSAAVATTFPAVDAGPFEGHKLSDYPAGRTRVPFTWRLLEERVAMELVAGLWGTTQDAERGAGRHRGLARCARAARTAASRSSPGVRDVARRGFILAPERRSRRSSPSVMKECDEPVTVSLWDAPKLRLTRRRAEPPRPRRARDHRTRRSSSAIAPVTAMPVAREPLVHELSEDRRTSGTVLASLPGPHAPLPHGRQAPAARGLPPDREDDAPRVPRALALRSAPRRASLRAQDPGGDRRRARSACRARLVHSGRLSPRRRGASRGPRDPRASTCRPSSRCPRRRP